MTTPMSYAFQQKFYALARQTMNETVHHTYVMGVDVRLEITGIMIAVPHNFQIHARLCFGNGYKAQYFKVVEMDTAFSYWWEQGWKQWATWVAEQTAIWRMQQLVMHRDDVACRGSIDELN